MKKVDGMRTVFFDHVCWRWLRELMVGEGGEGGVLPRFASIPYLKDPGNSSVASTTTPASDINSPKITKTARKLEMVAMDGYCLWQHQTANKCSLYALRGLANQRFKLTT